MTTVKIELEEAGLVEALLEYLNNNTDAIASALKFDAADRSQRAVVDEIEIKAIHLGPGNEIEIDYEYEWSAYHGCKDINDGGTEQNTIKGVYANGCFEFPLIERDEPRSTLDEF